MDNEAGMEHISRLTTSNADILLVVSDTSRRGIQAAVRINKLAKELNIGVEKSYLIINQTKNGIPEAVTNILNAEDLELAGMIPMDDTIYDYDLNGQPTIEIPENNQSVKAAFDIFKKIIQ
jgi:CO dehydrogenase maturation factor